MHFHYRIPALPVLMACCLLVSACGNKGSLTLPPKDDVAATAGAAKKAPDHNSQPSPSR